jgi:salicylate hydroxylase
MTETPTFDIAIIGAGPGGLCAAHGLANLGFSVAVFERARALRPIGAAIGLAEPGYQALALINADLATQVRALAANPQRQMLMRPNGEVLFSDESPLAGTPFTWLGWYSLQSSLHNTLPPTVSLHLNHKLINFTKVADPSQAPLRLQFENQPDVGARLLIGADGYHSAVRSLTLGDGAPLYTGTMTWRGMLPRQILAPLPEPFAEGAGVQMVVGDQKNFWIMDAGAEVLAWGGTALHPTTEKSTDVLAKVLQVFDRWTPFVEKVIRATDPTTIVETGVFDRHPVPKWGDRERITLLGDAAHPMRPYLGLGTTMAFEDAVALTKGLKGLNLQDTPSVAKALTDYEEERIAIAAPLQLKSREGGEGSHASDHADKIKAGFEALAARRRQEMAISD